MNPRTFVIHIDRFASKSDNVKVRMGKTWLYVDVDEKLRIIVDGFKNSEVIYDIGYESSKQQEKA